jgi:hypothetical protein
LPKYKNKEKMAGNPPGSKIIIAKTADDSLSATTHWVTKGAIRT